MERLQGSDRQCWAPRTQEELGPEPRGRGPAPNSLGSRLNHLLNCSTYRHHKHNISSTFLKPPSLHDGTTQLPRSLGIMLDSCLSLSKTSCFRSPSPIEPISHNPISPRHKHTTLTSHYGYSPHAEWTLQTSCPQPGPDPATSLSLVR